MSGFHSRRLSLFPSGLIFGLALFASAAEPWKPDQVQEPRQLAKALANARNHRPRVICVGMPFLYRSAHIPGSELLGPAGRPDGLESLEKWALGTPRDAEIILYCGCCPWRDCPNIRPAFRALQELGFTKLSVLYIPHNFKEDWIDQGYPAVQGK